MRLRNNWLPDRPVLPLTVQSIAVVLAQLKEGRYKSAGDYMSTAKGKHLEAHEWTSRLARQHRVCVRSALRGLGPSRQCAELPLDDLVKGAAAVAGQRGIPIGLANTCIVLYYFVLREIELGTMLATSVTIDAETKEASIKVPATKTDPRALGRTRSWDASACPRP